MADVRPRPGGIYSLFCYECNRWIPNTATPEKRKEGIFDHCHECGSYSANNNKGIPYEDGLLEEA